MVVVSVPVLYSDNPSSNHVKNENEPKRGRGWFTFLHLS